MRKLFIFTFLTFPVFSWSCAPQGKVSKSYGGLEPTTQIPIPFQMSATSVRLNGPLTLSWSPYPNAVSYTVIVSKTPDCKFSSIGGTVKVFTLTVYPFEQGDHHACVMADVKDAPQPDSSSYNPQKLTVTE